MIQIDYMYDPDENMGPFGIGKYNARSVAQPEINASAHTLEEITAYLIEASERVNGTPYDPAELDYREVSAEVFWS